MLWIAIGAAVIIGVIIALALEYGNDSPIWGYLIAGIVFSCLLGPLAVAGIVALAFGFCCFRNAWKGE